jgi:TP901 family phage tail tape measure protein
MAINLPIVSKFYDQGVKDAESALGKFGKVAGGIAAAATAAVAGIATVSIKEFANFDSALNQSLAIMGDVSATMRGDMSDAAREVAKTTTFSAAEAAEAFFFLASAGLDAEQSVAALPQVAAFAQAGMFDMATATDLATDAQSALGLTSDDAAENLAGLTRVTDVFVKANTLANTSVEQLAAAFTTKAGTALKNLGKEVEEGAAVLAVFADQGIKGEAAGTLLTNTLFGLSDRARASSDDFKRLGIEVFDSEGQMRNLADIADDLTGAFEGMTTEQKLAELANLGFNKQARQGILAIMDNGDAIREYEAALKDAGGTAEDVAGKQLETLSGQFELMKSAVSDVGIEIGAALAPTMLELIEAIGPIITQAGPMLVDFFKALAPVITDVVAIIPQLLEGITPLIPAFGDLFVMVADLVVQALPILVSLIGALIPIIVDLLPIFMELLEGIIAPLIPMVVDLVKQFVPFIERILPILIGLIEDLLPIFLMLLQDLFLPLIPIVLELIEAFFPLIERVLPILVSILENFVIPVLQFVAEVLSVVLIAAVGFLTDRFDDFSGFIEGFAEGFKGVWESIASFFKGIVNGMIGMFEGFVNFIIDGLNMMIRALNALSFEVPDWVPIIGGQRLGFNIPTIGRLSIPRLADGGVVLPQPGGVLANIAEGGQAEAVIPLDRFDEFGKGGPTYNITINAGIGTDPVSLGREVVNAIKRYESVSGRVFVAA